MRETELCTWMEIRSPDNDGNKLLGIFTTVEAWNTSHIQDGLDNIMEWDELVDAGYKCSAYVAPVVPYE